MTTRLATAAALLTWSFLAAPALAQVLPVEFHFTPSVPMVGETVLFINDSHLGSRSRWDFGDGEATEWLDGLPDATHVYEVAGNYTVTLTVELTPDGSFLSVPRSIMVVARPPEVLPEPSFMEKYGLWVFGGVAGAAGGLGIGLLWRWRKRGKPEEEEPLE